MVTLQLQTDSRIRSLCSRNHSILTKLLTESRVERQKGGQILKCVVAENTLKDCSVHIIFLAPSGMQQTSCSVGKRGTDNEAREKEEDGLKYTATVVQLTLQKYSTDNPDLATT